MIEKNDLVRLRQEYANREHRLEGSDIYTLWNRANLFIIQGRQRDVLQMLRNQTFNDLQQTRILEVGCGRGGVLLEYLSFGASPSRLHGCDLLLDHLRDTHHAIPHLPLTSADGQRLPYPANLFDLVMQYTVFSSILDDNVKQNLANEILRVLKPDGFVLWYDFWLNPTNPQARGIRPAEIRRLFPGCNFVFRRITLAPPITRRLVPLSWTLAHFLESLRIFNSHYLVVIHPDN